MFFPCRFRARQSCRVGQGANAGQSQGAETLRASSELESTRKGALEVKVGISSNRVRTCLIDGEVVCCDERGLARFDVLRRRRNEANAFLFAFDLLELNGTDLRREPIEVRKATLASILRRCRPSLRLNEHLAHPEGGVVFQHACALGCEGIVSKRLGSAYRSGRSPDWLKF